jgi:hypothetical protein
MTWTREDMKAITKQHALSHAFKEPVTLCLSDDEIQLSPQKAEEKFELVLLDDPQRRCVMFFAPTTDRCRKRCSSPGSAGFRRR